MKALFLLSLSETMTIMIWSLFFFFTTFFASEGFVFQPHQASRRSLALQFSPSDYAHTVQALSKALHESHEHLKQIEILSARLEEMEQHDPHIGDLGTQKQALKQAVAEAKAAIEAHGTASLETKNAFKAVDRLAAAKSEASLEQESSDSRYSEAAIRSHHAYNTIVDKELIQDSMQAIEKLMAFEHFVQVEEKRLAAEGMLSHAHRLEDSTPGMPWGGAPP